METEQKQPTQQNVNLETMSSEQLALILSEQYKQVFQVNQNIQAIEQLIRNRLAGAKIQGPPEQPMERQNDKG
ncbi:MAG: hypothetical protein PHF37_08490 [Phycisphaerae bacterium]|jgi:N-acetylmuramic acid 6-phosphate (MurNAc-6-P) etherase|nr:hypothetical protein [Phycisphaerae bacterium]